MSDPRVQVLNVEPLGYSDEAGRVLREFGEVVEEPMDRKQLLDHIDGFHVLITRLAHKIDREVIDAGHRLRAIVTATTGLDHIDVEYANSKDIAVLSLKGETEFLRTIPATAEHTWALMLALIRRIPSAFASVREGVWDRDLFRGRELDGRNLGLVGLGRVGHRVASYGRAFGMEVSAFDPYAAESLVGVARVEHLPDLLAGSDVVSLHVPLNDETRGMIGREELRAMPVSAVLVNTARGEVVDEGALVWALENGEIAGASVDVVSHERIQAKRDASPLLSYSRANDNLLITPHIGGATVDSMLKTELFMARKLRAYLVQQER